MNLVNTLIRHNQIMNMSIPPNYPFSPNAYRDMILIMEGYRT